MKISYFAKVREQLGRDEEHIIFPDTIKTVQQAVRYLRETNDYDIFDDEARLRFALDNELARLDAPIEGKGELAIFPPVTGG